MNAMRWLRHLPNALTGLRAVLALVFPWVPPAGRILVVAAALLTEYLDGALSRLLHAQTWLGRVADPVADKLFFAAVAGTMLVEGRLRWTELLLMGARDLIVALGTVTLLVAKKKLLRELAPRVLGKLTTVLQYIVLFNLVLGWALNRQLIVLTAVIGLLAAMDYAVAATRVLRRRRDELERTAA